MQTREFAMLLASCLLLPSGRAEAQQTELLILTADEFLEAVQPLKNFKDATGRPAMLVSLSQVRNGFTGVDDAEKVKKCIAHHVQYAGVKRALLVGDVDKFPVRWRYWGRWLPADPYFRGDWKVTDGQYMQSSEAQKPFGAWVDIGSYDRYTIEVDVTRLTGEARILFANADMAEGKYRLEIAENEFRLRRCENVRATKFNFAPGQTHRVKLVLAPANIQISVDDFLYDYLALGTYTLVRPGKVGIGTQSGTARFDNFKVTSSAGAVLVDEYFDGGPLSGFTDALTADERQWAVSELYYADLFRNGTYEFEDWDTNKNGLYGEIEFKVPNFCPNCTINNDNIDYLPDISVGRIPASSAAEVTAYVNKVVAYELATIPATWFERAALFEGATGEGARNDAIRASLSGQAFSIVDRHWEGDLKKQSDAERKEIVVDALNEGFGFVNYLGHGDFDVWQCMNFTSADAATRLTNLGMLPVVFAGACFTGRFAPIPPAQAYTDTSSSERTGAPQCEPFPGVAGAPHPMQANHDVPCIAEDLLFTGGTPPGSTGALVYLGEARAGRHWGAQLAEYFFKAYSDSIAVGDMWKRSIEDYYFANKLFQSHTWNYGPEKWEVGHMFDEPQKFVLFGDPSVRVGGAFRDRTCGPLYDGSVGPVATYSRYRIICDTVVPAGRKLTLHPASSLLFETGTKITAIDTDPNNGLHVNASPVGAVGLLTVAPNPHMASAVRGIVLRGQLRLRERGAIKFY
jgi:hypothetical protein